MPKFYQHGTTVYQQEPSGGYTPIMSANPGTYPALPQYGFTQAPKTIKPTTTPQPTTPQPTTPPSGGGGFRDPDFGDPNSPDLSNPVKKTAYENYLKQRGTLEQAPTAPAIDYDAIIRPALEGLDAAIRDYEGGTAGIISSVEGAKGTKRQASESNVAAQTATIQRGQAQAETEAERQIAEQKRGKESAANEARRQFAEIQQGLQARFGGTTGTGQFVGELLGRETTRNLAGINTTAMTNIANIRQNLSDRVAEATDKLQQIQEMGRIALLQIEDEATEQIAQAKNQLAQNLATVRAQKGEIQSRKAEIAQQAVQQYQETVAAVNARNTQFMQQLYMQQQKAEQELNASMQKAKQTAESIDWQWKTVGLPEGGQSAYAFNPQTMETKPLVAPTTLGTEKEKKNWWEL